MGHQPAFFLLANAEGDQNTENRLTVHPGHRPGPQVAIKTEVVGRTMETVYELVMIQIILFAPDTDNSLWLTEKLDHVEHN